MFPGDTPLVVYFSDTGMKRGSRCLVHDALLKELREILGEDSVVLR